MASPTMKAMVLHAVGESLRLEDLPMPPLLAGQLRLRVHACGVCRTDLHVVDGELSHPKLPLILGHEIIGSVVEIGEGVVGFCAGERVGVPWLGHTCGHCRYCLRHDENLCNEPGFTGYTINGGYAEFVVADHRYCFRIPDNYSDVEAAPLMCAGLIGYRSLSMAGDAKRLGIYGFGAAAHIIVQVACQQGREVYAFTRVGDRQAQEFARQLGAVWAGDSETASPVPLDAAMIFAPVGSLVPQALQSVDKGGTVVCAGIHMSDIPSFPYRWLWEERIIRSVANLTRSDGERFMKIVSQVPLQVTTESYPLSEANIALSRLRSGQVHGAAVLVPGDR